jgi:hypothetical protein
MCTLVLHLGPSPSLRKFLVYLEGMLPSKKILHQRTGILFLGNALLHLLFIFLFLPSIMILMRFFLKKISVHALCQVTASEWGVTPLFMHLYVSPTIDPIDLFCKWFIEFFCQWITHSLASCIHLFGQKFKLNSGWGGGIQGTLP